MNEKPNGFTRREQARQSKKEIVNAYIELVKERGVDNFTIKDICQKINISVGRFYHHFKSKDAVLFYMYYGWDDFVKNHPIPKDLDIVAQILAYYKLYADFNTALGLEYCKKIFSGSNTRLGAEKTDKQEAYSCVIRLLSQFSVEYGLQDTYSTAELYQYLGIVSRGTIFDWSIHDGTYDLAARMEKMIRNTLKGFLV